MIRISNCATSVLEYPLTSIHPRHLERSRAVERSPAESLGRGPPPRSNANPGSHPRCTAPPRPAPRTQVLAAVPAAPIYGGRAPRAQRSRCAAGQPNWYTPRLWPKPPLRCREWPLLPLRCELLGHSHLSATSVHAAHLSECFDRSRRSPVDTPPVAATLPGISPRARCARLVETTLRGRRATPSHVILSRAVNRRSRRIPRESRGTVTRFHGL